MSEVIEWFTNLRCKLSLTFVVFDIVDFYPSISLALLNEALDFAQQFVEITTQNRDIILHARKSILFSEKKVWNKQTNPDFDVTMGSFDGAEVCELVGLLILSRLKAKFNNESIGLYRDDGLAAFRNMGPRTADKVRKQFIDCFQQFGLRITCQANMKIVNFLDVTLNLLTGKYQPYRKDGNPPMFISANSNHPSSILKHLPKAIGYRISELSSNKDEFKKAAPVYNNALKAS